MALKHRGAKFSSDDIDELGSFGVDMIAHGTKPETDQETIPQTVTEKDAFVFRVISAALRSRSPVRQRSPSRRTFYSGPSQRADERMNSRSPLRSPRHHSPVRSPIIRKRATATIQHRPSASEIQADRAIDMIRKLQAGLFQRLESSASVLETAQVQMDECCKAFANWLGCHTEEEMDAAIRKAFCVFDTDHSGKVDSEEYAKAMHMLGLRLLPEQYHTLFEESDTDGSGEIDLAEFCHMVKKFLNRACKEICKVCAATDGSNQLPAVYRRRWVDKEEPFFVSASCKLQARAVALRAHLRYRHALHSLTVDEQSELTIDVQRIFRWQGGWGAGVRGWSSLASVVSWYTATHCNTLLHSATHSTIAAVLTQNGREQEEGATQQGRGWEFGEATVTLNWERNQAEGEGVKDPLNRSTDDVCGLENQNVFPEGSPSHEGGVKGSEIVVAAGRCSQKLAHYQI